MDITKRLGWRKQLTDLRDENYCFAPSISVTNLPTSADLTSQCPPVLDQGNLGSCVENMTSGVFDFARLKEGLPLFSLSRLFLYYNVRVMEGTVKSDAGGVIRDAFKSITKSGVCEETFWQYDISKFTRKPPVAAYAEAKKHEGIKYQPVTGVLDQMKACLAEGFPFGFGFSVYASFDTAAVAKTGIVPMPTRHEQLLGGHAVYAIGYDDAAQQIKCRNSWGTWGDNGNFYLPYEYLSTQKLASDFTTLRLA